MIKSREYYGKEDNPFGHKITKGKKYVVTVHLKQMGPDIYLEDRFSFIDDNENQDHISYHIIDDCFCSVDKWREIQFNELGI